MIAPVIDSTGVSTPTLTASTRDEARANELLAFSIGMGALAAIVVLMAVIGAIAGSAILLIASAVVGVASALSGVYAGGRLLNS